MSDIAGKTSVQSPGQGSGQGMSSPGSPAGARPQGGGAGNEGGGNGGGAVLGRIATATIHASAATADRSGSERRPAAGPAPAASPAASAAGAPDPGVFDNPALRVAARMSPPGGAQLFQDLAEGTPSSLRRAPSVAKPSGGPANIRLLPVMIFVAGVMLSVRVNDIWKGYVALEAVSVTTQSEAQQPPPPGGRKRGQKTPASTAAASPEAAAPAAAGAASPAPASPPPVKAEAPPPAVPPGNAGEGEPPTFTQSELDVLQKLSERREALDSRERDLNLRENLIKAAEDRIDKKITEMKTLQSSVESMLHQVDDQDDGKMKSLVKIYENMKPKDAAKIFEQLDMPILLGVMSHMKEQKVAPIMESMLPEKAKLVTDAMAQRRAAKTEGQGG